MKHLITKTIDSTRPPALLMRDDAEPEVLRLLAWFANPQARDIFDGMMSDIADGPCQWTPAHYPQDDPAKDSEPQKTEI